MSDKRYDVVAVNFDTKAVRVIAENKSGKNASAIEDMAVMRRGVEKEFFSVVNAGEYRDGDLWKVL